MLVIRMQRPGKGTKGRYAYKIVVMEKSKARDSEFVEQVGFYDPINDLLKFDIEKYNSWVKKGAQPTEKVVSLFKRYNKIQNKG